MKLTDEERDIPLPSGTQTRFYNRVTWALTYLSKSLLLQKTGRGRFKIAERGRSVIAQNPGHIDNTFFGTVSRVSGIQVEEESEGC